jgi:diketogulonate reductase-like aldo/keto reductase
LPADVCASVLEAMVVSKIKGLTEIHLPSKKQLLVRWVINNKVFPLFEPEQSKSLLKNLS